MVYFFNSFFASFKSLQGYEDDIKEQTEKVAKKIIRAIEKNKNFKGIPFGFHFIRFWQAILPTCLFDFIFGEVVGIYHGMENFTGRELTR